MPKTIAQKIPTNKKVLKIQVFKLNGEKAGQISIPEVLKIPPKEHLILKAVQWQLAKKQISTAHTKNRAERRGGGKKPWRQKGTGRARFGSSRNPIWRKGGVAFGPTPENNYQIQMPKKERKSAVQAVLSDKIAHQKLIIVEKLALSEIKTKKMQEILSNLNIFDTVLLLPDVRDEKIIKSARNLAYVKILSPDSLNILDLLNFEYILTTKAGFEQIVKTF